MELFVDTSALAIFYYPEPGSEEVEALLLAAERVFVSRLSIVEMASALAKKLRSRAIGKDDETRIWNAFQDDLRSGSVELIHIDEELIARAVTLVRDLGAREGLRTLDALQLASALNQPGALFLSADRRLTKTAALVGLGIPELPAFRDGKSLTPSAGLLSLGVGVSEKMRRKSQSGWVRRQVVALLGVFTVGVACGLLWDKLQGNKPATPDYTIHSGREGLTNPLLECEIAGYRPGQELRPFKPELDELLQRLKRERKAAQISVYFRDLDNGPWTGIDEDRKYSPASLFKVPVIMAAMKQAERDPALLRREVRFHGFPDDSLLARYQTTDPLVIGRTYRLRDLVDRTASASDNYAAALLGQSIDRDVLRRLLYGMGLPAELADNPEMPVIVSPQTYGRLFRVLYNAIYLNRDSSERIFGYFARSTFHGGITPRQVLEKAREIPGNPGNTC